MSRLLEATDQVEVDNFPPLYSGFSTGFHLLFHSVEGENNIELKSKLYRLYSTMCPALLQGYFMELTDQCGGSMRGEEHSSLKVDHEDGTGKIKRVPLAVGHADQSSSVSGVQHQQKETVELFALGTAVPRPRRSTATTTTTSSRTSTETTRSAAANTGSPRRKVRVGFLSRFLHTHPAGLLVQGLVSILRNSTALPSAGEQAFAAEAMSDPTLTALLSPQYIAQQWTDHNTGATLGSAQAPIPQIDFEVVVFLVDGGKGTSQYDAVQKRILRDASMAYVLPSQHIGTCAQAIRNAKLDILVFPELGLDPLAYFLAYARLAPVQVAWLGHPDTTALPNVDFMLSSHFEPRHAQDTYTERLYKMPYFGTQFVDSYRDLAVAAQSAPRTVILNRAKYVEKLQIPKSAHLYIVAHSLCKLHPAFDEVLRRILLQDR